MLTAHLNVTPRLGISAAIPLLFLNAFMVWAGTTLPFYLFSSQRSHIFTAVTEQMMGLFWVSAPFSGWMFRCLGGTYCLQLWGDWIGTSACLGERGRNLSVIRGRFEGVWPVTATEGEMRVQDCPKPSSGLHQWDMQKLCGWPLWSEFCLLLSCTQCD